MTECFKQPPLDRCRWQMDNRWMGHRTRESFGNDRLVMLGVFFVALSMFVFYVHFSKETIKTPSDLKVVQGRLLRYSFVDGSRRGHYYYIYFDGDDNSYQIPADFIGCFDKSDFEATVQAGDNLSISFNKRFFIFSIADAHRSYLPVDVAIERYNQSDLHTGIWFLVFGSAILIGRYLYKKQ